MLHFVLVLVVVAKFHLPHWCIAKVPCINWAQDMKSYTNSCFVHAKSGWLYTNPLKLSTSFYLMDKDVTSISLDVVDCRCIILKKELLKQHNWTWEIYCSFSSVIFYFRSGCVKIIVIVDKCSQLIINQSFCFMSKDELIDIIPSIKQHPLSTGFVIFS